MCTRKKTPNEESAVISGSTTYLFTVITNIIICAVDKVENKSLIANKVKVLPVLHKITVEYVLVNYTFSASGH